MVTREHRRAVLLLMGLTLAGLGVRLVVGRAAVPGAVAFRYADGDRPARDSVAAQAGRLIRPLRRGERIDVDRASVAELTRLPRIGPGLATRIAADREANGPFGSLEALDRVAGIGPATLEALRPHVRFSSPPRRGGPATAPRVAVNRAGAEELAALPGIGPVLAQAIVAERERSGPFRRAEDLLRVRGIGPATLARLRDRIALP